MFYITELPTDNAEWNHYLIYNISLVKNRIVGVFYIEELSYYGPVLDLDEEDLRLVDRSVFKPLHEDVLLRSLLVVCKRCGWCCEEDAGAFVFKHELNTILKFTKIDVSRLRRVNVRLADGRVVPIWRLDVERRGRCIFFDVKSRLCKIHPVKPTICILTYCARFAVDKRSVEYVRVGSKQNIKFIMVRDVRERRPL